MTEKLKNDRCILSKKLLYLMYILSMKIINDLGEEIRIPASRLIDYMAQFQIVYR